MTKGKKDPFKTIARNKKAAHDYILEDRLEAGIVLRGTEIKSARSGNVSLKEAHVQISGEEAWLVNAHIAPYLAASAFNHDPRRRRKLLLHRKEILRLDAKVRQRGYTVIPTRMYLKDGRAKLEIALARGKRKYDKRREIAEKDAARDIERSLARRSR
ncbi:MAG: SsrA-binding protein SmpB [Anaerolineales bacterium]|jgi:SsrA-binding protein|nr:SsrA-binding protein SmpB [Anaerolineales bacterium]